MGVFLPEKHFRACSSFSDDRIKGLWATAGGMWNGNSCGKLMGTHNLPFFFYRFTQWCTGCVMNQSTSYFLPSMVQLFLNWTHLVIIVADQYFHLMYPNMHKITNLWEIKHIIFFA